MTPIVELFWSAKYLDYALLAYAAVLPAIGVFGFQVPFYGINVLMLQYATNSWVFLAILGVAVSNHRYGSVRVFLKKRMKIATLID